MLGLGACSSVPAPGEVASPSVETPTLESPTARSLSTLSSDTTTPSPSPAPSGTASSTATVSPSPPTSTPTPLACLKSGGHIERGELRTELLRLPLEFRVYLPPCYREQADRRYPVLYLIHGQSYNDDQWDRLGADETADALIAAGEVAPFIIVMPRDRVWSQPTEDPFGQAVAEALVPWIDENYRTRPERASRAVGGLSRGAGWAIHLGFSRWELFGAIGAHSLPVFWTDLPHLRAWMDAIPREELPRIYMDLGDKERLQISRSAMWFEELLTEKNIPHEWHLYSGYHEEAYWEAHVEEYLRWYARDWQEDE
jgi:enterochelin esterase-like enzyme